MEGQRQADRIDGSVQFGRQPAARATDGGSFTPLLRPSHPRGLSRSCCRSGRAQSPACRPRHGKASPRRLSATSGRRLRRGGTSNTNASLRGARKRRAPKAKAAVPDDIAADFVSRATERASDGPVRTAWAGLSRHGPERRRTAAIVPDAAARTSGPDPGRWQESRLVLSWDGGRRWQAPHRPGPQGSKGSVLISWDRMLATVFGGRGVHGSASNEKGSELIATPSFNLRQ